MSSGFFGGGNKQEQPHLSSGDQREPGQKWEAPLPDSEYWRRYEEQRNRQNRPGCLRRLRQLIPFGRKLVKHG